MTVAHPCRSCLFNTFPEGCPDDDGESCLEENKCRKYIPEDITNPTYNYNSLKPEKAKYMAVYEIGPFNNYSETWFHCTMTLADSLNLEIGTDKKWPCVVFDRAGNIVARQFRLVGQWEDI